MPTGVRYPAEFKAEAIRLYKTSCKPHREVAEQLGIAPESLRRWVVQGNDDTKEEQCQRSRNTASRTNGRW